MPQFLKNLRQEYSLNYKIPQPSLNPYYFIVTYIEPLSKNSKALGLNIAFEKKRLDAALLARASNKTTISDRITLIQDEKEKPAFLILHPIYELHQKPTAQSNGIFRGWIYLPVLAQEFLDHLRRKQNKYLNFKVYEGTHPNPQRLIYQSNQESNSNAANYQQKNIINIMQKQWLVVWESTPIFDNTEESYVPLIVLIAGFLFGSLFFLFLLMNLMKRQPNLDLITSKKGYLFPIVIFVFLSIGGIKFYHILEKNQNNYLNQLMESEVNKISLFISMQLNDGVNALERLASRWQSVEGISYKDWQQNAKDYITQFRSLISSNGLPLAFRSIGLKKKQHNEITAKKPCLISKDNGYLLTTLKSLSLFYLLKLNNTIYYPSLSL